VILCETARLRIRHFDCGDAAFILRLLNEPSFIRHIADKRVRSLADAQVYLENGPLAGYAGPGHHLNCVELRDEGTPIGTCGVLKRDGLPHPDLGYAFLPEFWSRGYAYEAAEAVLRHARDRLGLGPILAITGPDNTSSMKLLGKLGFVTDHAPFRLPAGDGELRLFALPA
jgi:RimJ/RimL family protein N-acetyltransferase